MKNMEFGCFFILLFASACSRAVLADDMVLKCDESEGNYENQEAFCTVSGFYATYSHNVRIVDYVKANMTKFMKFYDSRLLYLPFKLLEFFPNLKHLDVSFTEILDISRNTFASPNNLSHLNMSNNNITTIDASVFIGASSLNRIDLSRNLIQTVNEFAFRGLTKIERIVLSFNRIEKLSNDIFLDNLYLEYVALDNNLIESLDPSVFSRLRRIREVNLANNRLIHLHPSTFQEAYGIDSLNLDGNRLNNFSLADKYILVRLDLDNNNLTSLVINGTKTVSAENNAINSITAVNGNALEKLFLSKNNIKDISNITQMTHLIVLDLSYNNIGPVNITTFAKLRRLKEFNLRSTGISQISFGMFSKQTSLETLNLSFNNISELNLQVFIPYLSKIKNFYIDGNNLTEIHGKSTFAYVFPGLVKIGLSRNKFNCSYLHSILLPPFLSSFVELHIEPEISDEESTHIRDITCVSTKHSPDQSSHTSDSEVKVLRDTITYLSYHGRTLSSYLLVMIILLSVIIVAGGVLLFLKYKKDRPMRYSGQFRNGSMVFRSNATMNSAIEH